MAIPIYGPDFGNAAWHERNRQFAKTAGRARPPNAYRVKEVADVTGLCRATIYDYVKRGVFKELKLKREHTEIWISKKSVLAWLVTHPKVLKTAVRYGRTRA